MRILCLLVIIFGAVSLPHPIHAGDYRGVVSSKKNNKNYLAGQKIYDGKAKAGKNFDPALFAQQIAAMDHLQNTMRERANTSRRRYWLSLAGRLNKGQFEDLRLYLRERKELKLYAGRAAPQYVDAMMWMFEPKAGDSEDKRNENKSELVFLHRLEDAVNKEGDLFQAGGYAHLAGQLNKKLGLRLSNFATKRYSVKLPRLSAEDGELYVAGQALVESGKPTLLPADQVDRLRKTSQSSWLRRLQDKLPRKSPKVEEWAGRLSDDDWLALKKYGRLRYGV